MTKPNLTDLTVLVEMANHATEAHYHATQPVNGEKAAFARLLKSGMIRFAPPNYGAGSWYWISPAGQQVVDSMVTLLDRDEASRLAGDLRRMCHDEMGYWPERSVLAVADLVSVDEDYDPDQWLDQSQLTADRVLPDVELTVVLTERVDPNQPDDGRTKPTFRAPIASPQ